MAKKNLFTALVLLNSFFYLGIAGALYWHQHRSLEQSVLAFYEKQAAFIRAELSDRKEFYQRWISHIHELPNDPQQRALFLKLSSVQYLGQWQGDGLVDLSAANSKPPFPLDVLRNNSNYLFHRDSGHLYFTYNFQDPKTKGLYTVTVSDVHVSLTRRLQQAGAAILILEKTPNAPPLALFSSLQPSQTEEISKKFPINEHRPRSVRANDEKFYILPLDLVDHPELQQTLLVAFNRSEFFFTLSLGMAVLLLTLFCVNSGLLFYGYLKTHDELD